MRSADLGRAPARLVSLAARRAHSLQNAARCLRDATGRGFLLPRPYLLTEGDIWPDERRRSRSARSRHARISPRGDTALRTRGLHVTRADRPGDEYRFFGSVTPG